MKTVVVAMQTVLLLLLLTSNAEAQVEIKDPYQSKELPPAQPGERPPTGKRAADRYMKENKQATSSGPREHYMGIHLGQALDSESWHWGLDDRKRSDVADLTIGVTYRMGEWVNSMDVLFRAEVQTFEIGTQKPIKLALMPMVSFPDANSKFPLYFGAGAGVGIFFKQVEEESSLSLDIQLFTGVRFFEVLDTVGFFAEAGLKNHFHILSDGQHNGVYFSVGTLFTF